MKQVLPALLALLTVQSLVCLAGAAAPVLAPVAARDLGIDPRLVGVLVAITFGIAAISSLACGSVVARFGAMRTSQATLIASAAGLVGLVIGTPFTLLMAAALLGIAYGPSQPAASLLLLRLTPAHLTNVVFSIRQTGVPIGLALAGGILPPLTLWLGWQGAVLWTAAIIVVVAVALEPLRQRLDIEEIVAAPFSFGRLVHPLRVVWATPILRRLVVMSFFYSMIQTSLAAFLVVYLNERLGLSLVVAGLVMTITQATAAVCRIVWGVVADRWISPWRLLGLIGIGTSICAWLLSSFTPAWPLSAVILVSALFGGTAVAWNGLFVAQMARNAPPGQVSQVSGAGGFAAFTGVTVGPALFTVMLAATDSYAVPFTVLSLFTLGIGLWLLLSDPRKVGA